MDEEEKEVRANARFVKLAEGIVGRGRIGPAWFIER